MKICTEPPIPIRQVRPDLQLATLAGAVEHAMAKMPAGRYEGATVRRTPWPRSPMRSNGVIARLEAGSEGTPASPTCRSRFGPGPIAFASTHPVAAVGSLDRAPRW